MDCEYKCGQFHVLAFGLAFGITWALGMFVLGLTAWLFGFGVNLVDVIGELYLGFAPTFLGSIIGAVWGFVDLFIAGVIIAGLYNLFVGHCFKKEMSAKVE